MTNQDVHLRPPSRRTNLYSTNHLPKCFQPHRVWVFGLSHCIWGYATPSVNNRPDARCSTSTFHASCRFVFHLLHGTQKNGTQKARTHKTEFDEIWLASTKEWPAKSAEMPIPNVATNRGIAKVLELAGWTSNTCDICKPLQTLTTQLCTWQACIPKPRRKAHVESHVVIKRLPRFRVEGRMPTGPLTWSFT